MIAGQLVRMSEELKAKLRKNGSEVHVQEFGECVGIVEGLTEYTTEDGYRMRGPEVDVRWKPTNLRYAYAPEDLVKVVNDVRDT